MTTPADLSTLLNELEQQWQQARSLIQEYQSLAGQLQRNATLVHGRLEAQAGKLAQVVEERDELREALRMARTVIYAENRYETWNKELAQIDTALNNQNRRSE